uniref:FolateBiopterin Transporter (FBT) family putative n=1 Tax=Albugo laibachii Nc14 TaxID=890382 RepID=F0WAQ2_9STRA|nr:folateBiopterin Transporter (FBT) family putative [Albugo laibachii Nc14]|eukprot:CCA18223.1 folateBiopterin Transporter (FBT) family putative [Albugo laibachii Nc14]
MKNTHSSGILFPKSEKFPQRTLTPYYKLEDDDAHSPASAHSMWGLDSVAIPVTYICTGLLFSVPNTSIEYFSRKMGASDSQLATINVVRALPWTIKVVFGILPDLLPISGMRFKPYMVLGYLISSFFYYVLSSYEESALSVELFTFLLAGAMVGIVMVDVMGDALVASRVLNNQETYTGDSQSTAYLCRYLSEMVGFWWGAIMFSDTSLWSVHLSTSRIFAFLAVLPFLLAFPFLYTLVEPKVVGVSPFKDQMMQIWAVLQTGACWSVIRYIVLFNACMVHNSAWGNYLKVAYRFSAFQYGAMTAMGATVTFIAIYIHRQCLAHRVGTTLRALYVTSSIIFSVFSLCNVLLVFGWNEILHIPPFWFAMGDHIAMHCARGIQTLPQAMLFVTHCPVGQEGVSFAFLTGYSNLANLFSHTISNIFLRLWPVELDNLQAGDFDGVWKLSLLSSLISSLPLLFTHKLLPADSDQLLQLFNEHSPKRGIMMLVGFAFALVWVVVLSVLAILRPCSILVGGKGCFGDGAVP